MASRAARGAVMETESVSTGDAAGVATRGRPTLSALLLARNEEQQIGRCLESVRWTDEIVVVDDMSTDSTAEICRRHGARVIQRRFDNFANQANFGLDHLTGDWVLSLDADEVVPLDLAQEIQRALVERTDCVGLTFKRHNHFLGRAMRYGGWRHDVLHLFRRDAGRFVGRVHYAPQVSGRVAALHGGVEHYPFQRLEQFLERQNRYTSMEAEELFALHGPGLCGRVLGQAVAKPLKLFWKFYVKKQGFREEMHGVVFSVLFAWVHFVKWAKYWERCEDVRIEDVVAPFSAVTVDQERYDRVLLMSHLCAYRTAGALAREKRVLEIGCGSGYGAYYLSHLAHEVAAIDMNPAAIEQASRLFRRPNLRYLRGQGTQLPFADGSFDCVCAFQVIEHIPEPQLPTFLGEIARVLTPEGAFVVSTLNLDYNRKNPSYEKPSFHEKEFIAPELKTLLEETFPRVELYGLYPGRRYRVFRRLKKWGMHRWRLWHGTKPVERFFKEELSTKHHVLRPRCDRRAIDLIAVCRLSARGESG